MIMILWKAAIEMLDELETDMIKLVKETPDDTDEYRRIRLVELDTTRLLNILRYICKEKEQQERSAVE